MTNVQDKIDSSRVKIDETLQRFADGFSYLRRSPILHTPAEDGLEFEDVSFPALDGVPLEAWYIAATGSSKLVIANHRPFLFLCLFHPCNARLATCRCQRATHLFP